MNSGCNPISFIQGEPLQVSDTFLLADIYDAINNRPNEILIEEVKRRRKYSGKEILEIAGNISKSLRDLGLGNGDIVTVCAESNAFETYSFFLGVWLGGITLSPINPDSTVNEIHRCFQITHSVAVYSDEKNIDKVKLAVKKLDWSVTFLPFNRKDSNVKSCFYNKNPKRPVDFGIENESNHILSVMFTSGTSGDPKGVQLRSVAFKKIIHSFSWDECKRSLSTTPVFWISNPVCFLKTLLNQGTFIINESITAQEVLQGITDYKPDILFTSNSILIDMCYIADMEKYNTMSLKKVFNGGTHLLLQKKKMILEKVFGGRNVILTLYGSTEAGMVTIMKNDVATNIKRYESIGKPVKGAKVKIVDVESGEVAKPFQSGEICVKSESIMKRYVQRLPTNDELDLNGWWHMGDIAYYDNEEYIYYVSRLKEIMKYRGHQVAPAELEMIINEHPDVIECCVVGKPHEVDGEWPAAYIVKKSSSILKENDIYLLVNKQVDDTKKLRGGVYFVEKIPKSSVGKVLRKELLKLL